MKRQRSRNRNPGNGGKPQHNANRAFESNGPDGVKIRGAAQHVFEKYQQLARDALTAGDRVLGESYQQHAEHYFRVLRAVQPNRPASDILGRDAFTSGYDIDFEDDGDSGEGASDSSEGEGERVVEGRNEWRPDPRYEARRDDRQRDDNRSRDDRSGAERANNERSSGERPNNDRNRERNQNQNRDDRSREDRPREDRPRNDRPRDERRFERPERAIERVVDPLAVVEPQATPLTVEPAPQASPVLRSQDGGVSHAPAFLQPRAEPRAETAEETEPRPRARRRRAPRSFEPSDSPSGEGSAAVDASEDA